MKTQNLFTDNTPVIAGIKVDNNTALYNNRNIYYKAFELRELIGTELGRVRHLKVSDNFLFQLSDIEGKFKLKDLSDKSIKIGSYDFKNSLYSYSTIKGYNLDYVGSLFDIMLRYCKDDKNREELTNEFLELFALDIFMSQEDRFFYNVMFERRDDDTLHLAPIYDFEYTLGKGKAFYTDYGGHYLYDNCLRIIKDDKSLKELIKEYPQFRDMLRSYSDIDIDDYIDAVAYRYNLNRNSIDYREINKSVDDKQKLIKRMIKTRL